MYDADKFFSCQYATSISGSAKKHHRMFNDSIRLYLPNAQLAKKCINVVIFIKFTLELIMFSICDTKNKYENMYAIEMSNRKSKFEKRHIKKNNNSLQF